MNDISWKDRVWNTIFSKTRYECLSCGENVRSTFNSLWFSSAAQTPQTYLFAPYLSTFICPHCRGSVTVCILCDKVVSDEHYMNCPYEKD